MLIRNVHVAARHQQPPSYAILDFVNLSWSGRSKFSLGYTNSDASRIAARDPNVICIVTLAGGCRDLDEARKCRWSAKSGSEVDKITTEFIAEVAREGNAIVFRTGTRCALNRTHVFKHARRTMRHLLRSLDNADQVLEEQNLITRATYEVMRAFQTSEDDSYAMLRTHAMRARRPLAEIASQIVHPKPRRQGGASHCAEKAIYSCHGNLDSCS